MTRYWRPIIAANSLRRPDGSTVGDYSRLTGLRGNRAKSRRRVIAGHFRSMYDLDAPDRRPTERPFSAMSRADMHPITSDSRNLAQVATELGARLVRFNEEHAGPVRTRDVALTVGDSDGKMIAGLTGEIFWNALYIHLVWVDEEHRRHGYGRSLMDRAETVAIEAACDCVYLSTFEFQAPGFYARLGYSMIGELSGVPPGSRRQWFCKKPIKRG